MSILSEIIDNKKREVRRSSAELPLSLIMNSANMQRPILSMSHSICKEGSSGIIAEFKRRSPSKGFINEQADAGLITNAYNLNGAAGLSVLTDENYFGAKAGDLAQARVNYIPILRKEFIIDEYQVAESRYMGADAVLLIAACLSVSQLRELACCARETGLEVIIEIHSEKELDHICPEANMVGINNRDLKSFSVDISRSLELRNQVPKGFATIAESGIKDAMTASLLKKNGFDGLLIGETFMRSTDPGNELKIFIEQLNQANEH